MKKKETVFVAVCYTLLAAALTYFFVSLDQSVMEKILAAVAISAIFVTLVGAGWIANVVHNRPVPGPMRTRQYRKAQRLARKAA